MVEQGRDASAAASDVCADHLTENIELMPLDEDDIVVGFTQIVTDVVTVVEDMSRWDEFHDGIPVLDVVSYLEIHIVVDAVNGLNMV